MEDLKWSPASLLSYLHICLSAAFQTLLYYMEFSHSHSASDHVRAALLVLTAALHAFSPFHRLQLKCVKTAASLGESDK